MPKDDHDHANADACCEPVAPAAVLPVNAAAGWLHVPTMDCVAEESEIRRALERVPGVRALTFRLSDRNLHIDATPTVVSEATDVLRRIGFDARPGGERPATPVETAHEHSREPPAAGMGRAAAMLAGALVLAIAAELVSFFAAETLATKALGLALAGGAIALAGFDVYRKGIAALLAGRLNINALMSAAVTGAAVIGQWAEAAMVMALYAIAELIEARAVERARNAITGLMAMAPETATVRQSSGEWQVQRVEEVPLRAIVRIGPGERVPLDGVVVAGTSSINQAPVTGESIPVDKEAGDPVFAGTINENGLIEVEVTALAANSTLARIIHAVEQAEGNRAPTQRFVDRFAAVYTPAVFIIAVLVAVSGPWLFGWPWLQAVYKALVLLVIACPCALVISTPVTIVSGLAAAARRGILIKGGVHLEGARHLKAVALDKTGTITEGKPRLVEWNTFKSAADGDHVVAIAASLAGHSDHPVSKAIAEGLPKNGTTVLDFKALPGRGVSGIVDRRTYALGNHRLIEERGQCSQNLESRLRVHENAGRTVTVLASNDAVIGIFAVADAIKAHSAEAVAELRSLGVHPLMLSGDNSVTARTIAEQAGIDDARGDLLPTDKLDALKTLRERYGPSAMIGDGINDAPALAQADIGFAMGAAGTDTAMEAADVVIMNDDLRRVPETIRLSRRAHAILWQNISLALGIKAIFFVLALFGSATMWMAVFADMGASLLVVGNGLRLLRNSAVK